MLIKRKQFLHLGSLATTSLLIPGFVKGFERHHAVPPGNKVLVIVQLSGGNDGLNTVIPVSNDIYYRERPRLSIAANESLALNKEAGLHPELTVFRELYDQGDLAILNSVGYPDPDRSHFRSMDIWHSASRSDEYISTGWLGRYLDEKCKSCDMPVQAVEIDDVLSLALKGSNRKGLAFTDPGRFYRSGNSAFFRELSKSHDHQEETASYLYKTMSEAMSSAQHIYEKSRLYKGIQSYPDTQTGKHFKTISSLIQSDINISVYYVSIGSFDTHVNQTARQSRLFTELNAAIRSFVSEMKSAGRFNDLLLMTFSEFGRRVSQNGSNGTDHGTANNLFFIGGGLKRKGFLNAMPDLSDLDDGDLKHAVDFKNVYATILKKWLNTDDKLILGKNYELMDFI